MPGQQSISPSDQRKGVPGMNGTVTGSDSQFLGGMGWGEGSASHKRT